MGESWAKGRVVALVVLVTAAVSQSGCHVAHNMFESGDAAPDEKVVALTFDDGPSPYTNQVLDLLARHGVHATFFITGVQAERYPWIVARIVMEGHRIGNHTWNHASLTSLSQAGIDREVGSLNDWLGGHGVTTSCVRPPEGAQNQRVVDAIGRHHLSRTMMWSIDTNDWRGRSSGKIVGTVMSSLHPGAVVLMHDGVSGRSPTVAAVDQMIPLIRDAGYTIRPVC